VRQTTVGGRFYGNSCRDESCAGLLWEAHFVTATGGTPYEHEVVLWGWRRCRAEVEGRTFLEPLPDDPRDQASERVAVEMDARLLSMGIP